MARHKAPVAQGCLRPFSANIFMIFNLILIILAVANVVAIVIWLDILGSVSLAFKRIRDKNENGYKEQF